LTISAHSIHTVLKTNTKHVAAAEKM